MNRELSKSVTPQPTSTAKSAGRPRIFDDLVTLADTVKRVFTLERRMQESRLTGRPSAYVPAPGLDGRGATLEAASRKSFWLKIAVFLADKKIGPIDYLARQFDQSSALIRPLFANELLGPNAWKRYTDSKATKQQDLAIRLRSYRSSLESQAGASAYIVWPQGIGRGDETVERYLSALYCDDTQFPLFAYCVAVQLGQHFPAYANDATTLARRFEVQAAVEYVRFRPDYDIVWQGLIPCGFRRRAEEIYRDLLARLF